jgi:hypothetical protein
MKNHHQEKTAYPKKPDQSQESAAVNPKQKCPLLSYSEMSPLLAQAVC